MIERMEIVHLYPSLCSDADGAAVVVRTLIREQLALGLDVKYSVGQVSTGDIADRKIT